MTKADDYRAELRRRTDWDAFLLSASGLPGPRGNLELAQVVADEGDLPLFQRYLAFTANVAPVNSPYEFLAFCGVVGLGRLAAEGQTQHLATLREFASDPRWRLREAVAMALQRVGDRAIAQLLTVLRPWSQGNYFEQRAAVAALCEPRLLGQAQTVRAVLDILDEITAGVVRARDPRTEAFVALRKGLGYCWSVAVAALPAEGKPRMERWLRHGDSNVQWIMRENLKKARLARMDGEWVRTWQSHLVQPDSPNLLPVWRAPAAAAVKALLVACALPTADLASQDLDHFFACGPLDNPVGVVGLELYAAVALLRSLAVAPPARSAGCGRRLVATAEDDARSHGVTELYLLTTTAEGYFAALGYKNADRSAAPAAIRNTTEFAELCPASAVFMVKRLAD